MLGNGDVIFLCMQRRMRRWTCVQGTHDTRLGVYMQKPHCHQSYMNGAKAVLWQQCAKHTPCEHKLLIKPGMHGLHNRRCIHCVLLEAAMSPLAVEIANRRLFCAKYLYTAAASIYLQQSSHTVWASVKAGLLLMTTVSAIALQEADGTFHRRRGEVRLTKITAGIRVIGVDGQGLLQSMLSSRQVSQGVQRAPEQLVCPEMALID